MNIQPADLLATDCPHKLKAFQLALSCPDGHPVKGSEDMTHMACIARAHRLPGFLVDGSDERAAKEDPHLKSASSSYHTPIK